MMQPSISHLLLLLLASLAIECSGTLTAVFGDSHQVTQTPEKMSPGTYIMAATDDLSFSYQAKLCRIPGSPAGSRTCGIAIRCVGSSDAVEVDTADGSIGVFLNGAPVKFGMSTVLQAGGVKIVRRGDGQLAMSCARSGDIRLTVRPDGPSLAVHLAMPPALRDQTRGLLAPSAFRSHDEWTVSPLNALFSRAARYY